MEIHGSVRPHGTSKDKGQLRSLLSSPCGYMAPGLCFPQHIYVFFHTSFSHLRLVSFSLISVFHVALRVTVLVRTSLTSQLGSLQFIITVFGSLNCISTEEEVNGESYLLEDLCLHQPKVCGQKKRSGHMDKGDCWQE